MRHFPLPRREGVRGRVKGEGIFGRNTTDKEIRRTKQMAKFKDLRDWINQAREIGELAEIEGADPKFEMGSIAELSSRNQGPAVLHRAAKGHEPNFRVLTNMMS